MALRTPLKAIRAKCIDCVCGQVREVARCPCLKCPLYEYRMGHRPKGGIDTYPNTVKVENNGASYGLTGEDDT
jgi:hypothetical protein